MIQILEKKLSMLEVDIDIYKMEQININSNKGKMF